MKNLGEEKKNYLAKLRLRGQDTRVNHAHQLVGLAISAMLSDVRHKALYIKLAKEFDSDKLIGLAKSVAGRKNIRNPGAYFMRLVDTERETLRK